MTLTIDVPDSIAERWRSLSEEERREQSEAVAGLLVGFQEERPAPVPPTELKFVTETSPETKARLVAHAAEQAKALAALYARWETEDDDDIDLETLKTNMNANRAATGERLIF